MAVVRAATPADSAEIGALHVAVWRDSYRGLVPDALLASLSVRQRIETWLRILSEPPGPACTRVHVTCTGTQVDGFVSCGPQRNTDLHAQGFTGEITALYVRRSSQGPRPRPRSLDRCSE